MIVGPKWPLARVTAPATVGDEISRPTTDSAIRQPGLFEISRRMKRSLPVFIVGEARSGSTILYRTLLKHPAFKPREENLQESSFTVQAPDAFRFGSNGPRNLQKFLLEDAEEWSHFLESVSPLRWWLRVASLLGPTFAWRWRLGPTKLVARSYVFHAKRSRSVKRLLEKTPNHIYHIDRLLACFPAARLLYIHRHPVDVYSSLRRRGQVDPKADWARVGPDEFCKRYRHHLRLAMEAERRYPESMMLIGYDDFTSSPENELERICDFLGAAYSSDALTDLDDPSGWAHWERSRHLYEGIKTHTKRWQDYCEPHEARDIQQALAAEMAHLGYEPYTPDDQLMTRGELTS